MHWAPVAEREDSSVSYELVAELEDLVQIFDEERRHLRRAVGVHEDLDARYQTFLGAHGGPLDLCGNHAVE